MSFSCCPKSANSIGILHNLDCPAYCPAHDQFDCPGGPHHADEYGQVIQP